MIDEHELPTTDPKPTLTFGLLCYCIKTLPLKVAWLVYVVILQHAGGRESHGWNFDPWQHEVIYEVFTTQFVCINRCRGGSKTRDMSALAVFFNLRGLVVIWMAANRKQLKRAQAYWNENYFCYNRSIGNQDFIYCKDGSQFMITVLKHGLNNDRGPRGHCMFYDEMSQMPADLVENTRQFSAGMDWDGSPIYWIHFSTPEINSTFHLATLQFKTITHNCLYPSWFSVKYLHLQKETLAPKKFMQEMMCVFTSMAGSLLEAVIHEGVCPEPLESKIHLGQDSNSREGYCVVGVRYTRDYKKGQTVFCHNFGAGALGKTAMLSYLHDCAMDPFHYGYVEFETNGVGMPVWDDFGAMFLTTDVDHHCPISGIHWDDSDKIRRVNILTRTEWWFPTAQSKEMRECFMQVASLSLTERGDKIDKPTDKQWHFNDSFMHAGRGKGLVWA